MAVALHSRRPMMMDDLVTLTRLGGFEEFKPDWYEGQESRFFRTDEGSIEAWEVGDHIHATARHCTFFEDLFITGDDFDWPEYAARRGWEPDEEDEAEAEGVR
jgi:hypothetical protein